MAERQVEAKRILMKDPEVIARTGILKRASEINPGFRNPHIQGGFLRDVLLDAPHADCDVVFEGDKINQPGISECVQEAEERLGTPHYGDWEFENALVAGPSKNIIDNTIGFFTIHGDHTTLMMLSADTRFRVGSERTIPHLERRVYEVLWRGIFNLQNLRGWDPQYVLAHEAARGVYLCTRLNLHPDESGRQLFTRFEENFDKCSPTQQTDVLRYWQKKTSGLHQVSVNLMAYDIRHLPLPNGKKSSPVIV